MPLPSARSWLLRSAPAPWGPWPFWVDGVAAALTWLTALGLRAGARVGLATGNLPSSAALLQALPLAGMTTVLFNHRLSPAELREQASRSRLSALLASPEHALAGAGLAQTHLLPVDFAAAGPQRQPSAARGPSATDAPAHAAHAGPACPAEPAEPALVLFTSGTSGRAKAARLPLHSLLQAGQAAAQRLALRRDDTWLACLSLDHIGGASIIYRAGCSGYQVLLLERFEAATVDALLGQDISGASLVPTMLHRLVGERSGRPWPERLRVLLIGGAPLAPELAAACAQLGLAPTASYGLTEAASQVCTAELATPGDGTCGTPLPGMQVRIRSDASGTGADEQAPGLIEVRGAGLFSGYEEHGELIALHGPDAWFPTGDLGSLDARGRLRVHGRRSDLILSGGENVYPAEIEATLERHPGIAEAGVHGVDDPEWGQVVAAVLVARGPRVEEAALSGWLEANLSGFKRPRRWRWAPSLPRTGTGKLQRHLLAAWQS